MRTWELALGALGLLLVGCGSNTETVAGGEDATTPDGTAGEGGRVDAPSDGTALDSSSIDAGPGDVYAADGACACVPYWCGCGACNPGDIACTVNPPACSRGCVSSCPQLQQTTCTCSPEGRCLREGIDASTIGCLADEDCPVGDCCAFAQGKGTCAPNGNTCCKTPCP